jgi:hypothetical protein
VPDLLITVAPTSELEAVNLCIESMGEEPYTTLTPSPSPDVDKALAALNRANRDCQARGWNWNREYNVQTVIDTNGKIPVGPNVLRIVRAYAPQFSSWSPANNLPVVNRGGFLYDQLSHSFTFSCGAPIVDEILLLPWCDLPESARAVITYGAVELFQSWDQQSSPTLQVNAKVLTAAWITLQQEEDEQARWNSVYGSLDGISKIMGNMGMRRNRSPY